MIILYNYKRNKIMEVRILELFAAFCLLLSICRPLVRDLWKLDGLVACPLLAFAVVLGIFPSYGFRPECIPLLAFALFLTLANLSDLIALFSGLQCDVYRDKSLGFIFLSGLLFVSVLWICFFYAPRMDIKISAWGVQTLSVHDKDGEFTIWVYGKEPEKEPEQDKEKDEENTAGKTVMIIASEAANDEEVPVMAEQRPLLIFLPPVAGSLTVTEGVCKALRDKGFTVLTYSRPGFDSPAFNQQGEAERLYPPGLLRVLTGLTRGLTDTTGNNIAREMEERRKLDAELIFRELAQNKTLQDMVGEGRDTVFLAGYGAGGSAITFLAGQDDLAYTYPQIKAVITIEAPLYSALEADPPVQGEPLPNDPVDLLFRQLGDFAQNLLPKPITRVTAVPRPVVPALFIVSDKVAAERDTRYETILRTLAASRSMSLLAAVPGAGPFDYSDSPLYFPILSVLFRGAARIPATAAGPELTASLIANFAAMALSASDAAAIVTTPLSSDLYLEAGGVWNNTAVSAILWQ
jgi:hypothetical protein